LSCHWHLASTAILIPKDIEDRTLYTILCKPVPRLDYLIGKLLGVLALIFIALLVMDILLSLSLYFKCKELIILETNGLQALGSQELIDSVTASLEAHSSSMNVHYATISIFWKAALVASIALLISTFSTSTIFTIILTIIIILIGMIQAEAREFAIKASQRGNFTNLAKFSYIVAVVIPDFQFMSVDDGVIDGKAVPFTTIVKITIIALFYVAIYTVLSWFTFRKKEF